MKHPRLGIPRWSLPLLLAATVGVPLALWLRAEQRRAVAAFTNLDATEQSADAGASAADQPRALPSPALVVSTLRQLKLVTVRLDSAVASQVEDESWRGDVSARVTATATTLYGVDLSALNDSALRYNPLSATYTITLPAPQRIATEIITGADDQRAEVVVGWGRLRDVAGEYYLGLARARLHETARDQALSPDQRALVERLSREQVAALLTALLETDRPIVVEFTPEPEPESGVSATASALSESGPSTTERPR